MNRKTVSGIMSTLLLISMLMLAINIQPVKAESIIWTVDDDLQDCPDADFTKIQEAVNAAADGDVVLVYPGTYIENVDVNKSLTIKSEYGSDSTVVQVVNSNDHVFEVTADYVNISGFTAKGATGGWKAGIYLLYADYCDISDNIASNNLFGIYLAWSNDNRITSNTASNNSADGIFVRYSRDLGLGYNSITNNICLNNGNNGIELQDSNGNSITNNTCSNNNNGIVLRHSHYDTIKDNTCLNNKLGIGLGDSRGNSITDNCLDNNDGIRLSYSGYNDIKNNIVKSHILGIYMLGSRNHVVTDNRFENCGILIGAGLERARGHGLSCYNTHTIEGNTINGKPIYYYKDTSGIKVPEDAGEVILANCINMTVENIDASGGSVGIELGYTANSTISSNTILNNSLYGIILEDSNGNGIKNNTCSNNWYGILLRFSSDNSITRNKISNNLAGTGLGLIHSNNNKIHFNNFVDNKVSPSDSSGNIWDDGYPSGGNYWSDYEERYPDAEELDDSGIWDHPYVIDANNQDRYPLVKPWSPVQATVYIDPSTITTYPGATFNVSIMVSNVQNLWAWQAGIQWDPTVLELVSFARGNLQTLAEWTVWREPTVDQAMGRTYPPVAETIVGPDSLASTTSLKLLSITFRAINSGTSPINLSNVVLKEQDPTTTTAYAGWGDADGDLTVNIIDIANLMISWFTGIGDPSYSPSADHNGDGFVDISDLAIAGSNYGREWDGLGDPPETPTLYDIPVTLQDSSVTTLPPLNQPPTCVIELRKDGVEIYEIDVWEFFDIYVGDSTDDTGINQVRFSSDDFQDGNSTGEWTDWYDWDSSFGNWNASTKIKGWAFATGGDKEVWAEVKDDIGQTAKCSATIRALEWTFAIITDLHIGREYPDYGADLRFDYLGRPEYDDKGYDDKGALGQDYYLTKRLEGVVDWINDNHENENIKFLVVLGDLADSGEYSELEKVREILDRLEIPYFPVIGNHDVKEKLSAENYKAVFDKTFFISQFGKLGLEEGEGWWEDQSSELQNYAFTYREMSFVCLDFVSRSSSVLNPNWEAFVHDVTKNWLNEHISKSNVVLFSHHPLVAVEMLEVDYSFDDDTLGDMETFIGSDGWKNVLANFAGHIHGFWGYDWPVLNPKVFMNANVDYSKEKPTVYIKHDAGEEELKLEPERPTPGGIPVVTTEALMVSSNEPTPKGIIRIVKVGGEEIDYSIIDGEFRALNPCFREIDMAEWRPPWKFIVEFEVYAFAKRFTQERPGIYIMDFGDGTMPEGKDSGNWKNEVQFEHDYKRGKHYDVTLTVIGWTPGGERIEEEITRGIYVPTLLSIGAFSPVDITVTDPDGLTISKQLNEIPRGTYTEEIDFNGDGELDDIIVIPDRKIGDYLINVIPEPDAAPTDTYTLEVIADNATFVLAENVQITNIPTQPYIVRSTEIEVIPTIPATVDFDPDTLNLESEGRWVTVYIELPVGHGYNVSMIDLESLWLNGQVQAEVEPIEIGDYDGDGILDLMVKFNCTAVQFILEVGESVEITISGALIDGRLFEGKDTIKVIRPP